MLNAFGLEEEPGHFCGPDSATEMVDANVREWHERISAELDAADEEEYDLDPPMEARLAMVGGHYDYVEEAKSEAIQEMRNV